MKNFVSLGCGCTHDLEIPLFIYCAAHDPEKKKTMKITKTETIELDQTDLKEAIENWVALKMAERIEPHNKWSISLQCNKSPAGRHPYDDEQVETFSAKVRANRS